MSTTSLRTSVPAERPRKTFMSAHGLTECFDALSADHARCGETLRDFRTAQQMPLGAAARRLGITVVMYSECERGVREFDLREALKLLGAT
jgi:hypothetical protein